jgi:iron complex outermembrane receptor protein
MSRFLRARSRRPHASPALALGVVAAALSASAGAQQAPPDAPASVAPAATTLSPVVVTGTRTEARSFDLPMSIDSIPKDAIQNGKAKINVSETLNRVPGTFVQNRENFAQELQITVRGFGARSQFGTRGIRLFADGIPASTPDGQGSPGIFDLGSAERIEVLRGAFSALYGNHSGGVVQLFTENGPPRPTIEGSVQLGSYSSERYGLKAGGTTGPWNYIVNGSWFATDGYRDYSAATKSQFNTKVTYDVNSGNRLTFVATGFDQPKADDPLGLTWAQVEQNRRQAQSAALQFRTRRSLSNYQGGFVLDSKLTDRDALRAMVYVGTRSNEQFLAIPLANQTVATSSGGVAAFDRDFGGGSLRWTRTAALAGAPLTLTAGADYDTSVESRQAYINDLGVRGALKRDERNTVSSWGAYAQGEWQFLPRWALSLGLRYTNVDFKSEDRFIRTGNPDDSGKVSYDAWTPVVGLVFKATPLVNLYANYGRSFETPTLAELAYRPDGQSGLNFSLKPSTSHQYEVGAKAIVGETTRINLALFRIETDSEVVIARNTGGRSSFQNATNTLRHGLELLAETDWNERLSSLLSATWLRATYDSDFRTCAPLAAFCNPVTGANTAVVPSGNRVPGVPNYYVFGNLQYRHAPWGLTTALEAIWSGPVEVNDFNSESAPSYFIANIWAGLEQRVRGWRFREFVRVNNLFDEEYIGAVVVGDANGRYYAPAPTRNFLFGVSAAYTF